MLIRNYGLLWKRDDVDWGGRGNGNAGQLLGWTGRRNANAVNFRMQRGIYVLYDDNFKIVYIGQTGAGNQRLLIRLRNHRFDHLAQRWSRFSWFGISPVVDEELVQDAAVPALVVGEILNHIEAILIASAEPPLNLQRGRFGENVERYIQFVDQDEDGVDDAEE
jgi:hypothetical protein